MKLAIIAGTLAIVAAPAAFAEPYTVYGSVHSVDVYTGDLNLADPADREEAAYRIDRAAHIACRPFPDVRVLQEVGDWRDCRADAFDEGIAELEGRSARHRYRGRVETREYQGEPEPPPPPEPDDED